MVKTKKNKMVLPLKDYFYCVHYEGDVNKTRYSVPGDWIIECKEKLPYDTYVYYHPKSNDIKSPSHGLLYQLIQYDSTEKKEGLTYKATILRRFDTKAESDAYVAKGKHIVDADVDVFGFGEGPSGVQQKKKASKRISLKAKLRPGPKPSEPVEKIETITSQAEDNKNDFNTIGTIEEASNETLEALKNLEQYENLAQQQVKLTEHTTEVASIQCAMGVSRCSDENNAEKSKTSASDDSSLLLKSEDGLDEEARRMIQDEYISLTDQSLETVKSDAITSSDTSNPNNSPDSNSKSTSPSTKSSGSPESSDGNDKGSNATGLLLLDENDKIFWLKKDNPDWQRMYFHVKENLTADIAEQKSEVQRLQNLLKFEKERGASFITQLADNVHTLNQLKLKVQKLVELRAEVITKNVLIQTDPETQTLCKESTDEKAKRTKRSHIPEVHDKIADYKQKVPEFTIDLEKVPLIKNPATIMSLHDKAGHSINDDSDFVYRLMRHVFDKETLGTHSYKGASYKDEVTGEISRKILDRKIVEYVYEQYKIRVLSVGINDEERKARADKNVFIHYLALLYNNEQTQYKKNKAMK